MTLLVAHSPRLRRGGTSGAFLLALLGFLVALATAGYIVYRDPPWGRLSKYDFSTAENALKSQLKMEANADVLALVQYTAKFERNHLKEKLDTLEIAKTADYDKKTVLFIKYKETDKKTKETKDRKEVEWFEKDEDTGYWKPVPYVDMAKLKQANEKLAEEITKWTLGP